MADKPPKYRPDDWPERAAAFFQTIGEPGLRALAPTMSDEERHAFAQLWREAKIPTYDEYQKAQRSEHLPAVGDALKRWFLDEDD